MTRPEPGHYCLVYQHAVGVLVPRESMLIVLQIGTVVAAVAVTLTHCAMVRPLHAVMPAVEMLYFPVSELASI